ncbi:hypothetical protein AAC387_Pa02g2511 [Persea americana]
MEKKHRRLGISCFFHAYLRSCQSRKLSSNANEPLLIHRDFHLFDSSPTSFILPSKTSQFIAFNDISNKRITPKSSDTAETRCPHPSLEIQEIKYMERRSESKKHYAKKKQIQNNKIRNIMVSSNSSAATSHRFFSSDHERVKETEAMLSSTCSSSDSCEFYHHAKKKTRKLQCRKAKRQNPYSGFIDFASIPKTVKGKTQRSIAMVKLSNDPYGDFMSSMVEMIVEKQMYTTGDLEQLLYCFLLLNSPHHHQVIVEVFSGILETLFPSWNS